MGAISLRFASLGSGSRGNALLVRGRDTTVLVDCGFSVSQIEQRLARLDLTPGDLDAIVITHEHADHIGGAAPLSCKYDLPVWMTAGTLAACKDKSFHRCELFHAHAGFALSDLRIKPFPVPHDAREPCQFVFDDGEYQLGLLTDTGSITPHIVDSLRCCDALLLECNYEPELLEQGPYPWALKQRIKSNYGHLSNGQAAELLRRAEFPRLRTLIGLHISEQNNRPELALAAMSDALQGSCDDVRVADQDNGFGWV
ncbi:MAG: MBL fold metallo-hydrolase [Gammaproteobacteria bacterium]